LNQEQKFFCYNQLFNLETTLRFHSGNATSLFPGLAVTVQKRRNALSKGISKTSTMEWKYYKILSCRIIV